MKLRRELHILRKNPFTDDSLHIDTAKISTPGEASPFYYWLFRSTFISADHPALKNLDLKPLDPQPDVFTVED